MKAKLLLAVVVSSLVPLAVYAHDCSGGADGGMDATGNQCSDEIAATPASSDRAASTRTTKLDARKAASCNPCASKSKSQKQNASAHPRVKQG
jgi:hypothetical protein